MAPIAATSVALAETNVAKFYKSPESQEGFDIKGRPKGLVSEALLRGIADIDPDTCLPEEEEPFFVCDLNRAVDSLHRWREELPMVHPFYAVKCNTDPELIKLLGNMGVNFDCASKNEIAGVLSQGFLPNRIIYANPCKTSSYLRYAANEKVNLTTVDNADELYKIKKYHPRCDILIRIATDDESAQCRLSTKFGCTLETCLKELLPLAEELKLRIKGVAFHIGSGAKDLTSIEKAMRDSRAIFDEALLYGFDMSVVDIGGGFEQETFGEAAQVVRDSIDEYFPISFVSKHNIRFIAEPGRYFASNAFTLVTHVIGRREITEHSVGKPIDNSVANSNPDIEAMIYINDGLYGNLNCVLFDHQKPVPHVLSLGGQLFPQRGPHYVSLWGPTCDGLDCISERCHLEAEVNSGDWIYFPNLGAYTSVATTAFNGFTPLTKIIHIFP